MDLALNKLIQCKFRFSGQTCISVNRVFLQSSIADKFIEKLKERMKTLKVGNGQDKKTDIGPLINSSAVEKMKRIIQDALEKGGRILLGGKVLKGNFLEPTLITNCHQDMEAFKNEIFGPIVAVSTFESQQEELEKKVQNMALKNILI
jgi:succinate-semialdehyde dehydrogenase/glutarate-semialdehyde dehydrogenase